MRKLIILCQIILLTVFLLPVSSVEAAPSISVSSSPTSVAQYEKLEIAFTIGGIGTAGTDFNPYNPNLTAGSDTSKAWNKPGVYVDALFTKPSGGTARWPAYWDGSKWMTRFTPTEKGAWSYQIFVKHSSGSVTSDKKTFTVTDAKDPRGFVKINPDNKYTFRFDNGETFTPIGSATTATDSFNSTQILSLLGQNGGNYARVFQETGTAIEYPGDVKTLNNYKMSTAQSMDSILAAAEANGVYIDFTLESWTRLQPNDPAPDKTIHNPYILAGLVKDVGSFFSNATALEIYKRKLRYILARWGYSTHIMGIEFINETGGGTTSVANYPQSKGWLTEMGAFVKGDTTKIPAGWGGGSQTISVKEQGPHLTTCSNGDMMLTDKYIPWGDDAAMDYINEHQYLKNYFAWDSLDTKFSLANEKLGSSLDQPWKDPAVLVDRLARITHLEYKWNKPISITEYAPAIRDTKDWNNAMISDKTGQHVRDAMWQGFFSGISVNHWKASYIAGDTTRNYGPSKMWIFKPMSNYFKQISLDNMTTETAYSEVDKLNANPKIVSSNPKIMATAWLASDKAYFYTKNATDVWAQLLGATGCVNYDDGKAISCGPLPTSANQTGDVKIKGLNPGNYTLTKWSTTETDPAKQILETKNVVVGSDGIATVNVSLGTTDGTYDYAYKLNNTGSIKITSTSDKATLALNDTFKITNTINNTTLDTASELSMADVLPYGTKYVSATDSGVSTTKDISCDKASTYNFPACASGTSTFKAPVVTWSGTSVASNSKKNVSLTLQYVGTITPPAADTSFVKLAGATPITIEAEDTKIALSGTILAGTDTLASGGKYVGSANGAGNGNGAATFKVDATGQTGKYYLWSRVNWLDTSGNTFSVKLDSGTPIVLGNDTTYNKWQWIKLTDSTSPSGTLLNLTGQHTITFANREDGAKLDEIVLTTDANYTPEGAVAIVDPTVILTTGATALSFEAEDSRGTLTPKMVAASDSNASGGKYLNIPNTSTKADDGKGSVVYKIDATKNPGTYYLWAKCYWLDTSGNSLGVKVGSAADQTLGNDTTYKSWHWVKLPKSISLTGATTLTVTGREDGSRFDKIVLTTDNAYVPQ